MKMPVWPEENEGRSCRKAQGGPQRPLQGFWRLPSVNWEPVQGLTKGVPRSDFLKAHAS